MWYQIKSLVHDRSHTLFKLEASLVDVHQKAKSGGISCLLQGQLRLLNTYTTDTRSIYIHNSCYNIHILVIDFQWR